MAYNSSSHLLVCVLLVAVVGGSMAQEKIPITDHVYGGLEAGNQGGTLATLGAKANVFNNGADADRLDARAQVSKQFHPNLPPTYGLGLDYAAPKAGANVDVSRVQGFRGTNVNGGGHVNLWESRDRRTQVDATASFQQQFNPRTRPDYGFGARFRHNF